MQIVDVAIWCAIGATVGVASANWQSEHHRLGRSARLREFAWHMLAGAMGALAGVRFANMLAQHFAQQELMLYTPALPGVLITLSSFIGALVLILLVQTLRTVLRIGHSSS